MENHHSKPEYLVNVPKAIRLNNHEMDKMTRYSRDFMQKTVSQQCCKIPNIIKIFSSLERRKSAQTLSISLENLLRGENFLFSFSHPPEELRINSFNQQKCQISIYNERTGKLIKCIWSLTRKKHLKMDWVLKFILYFKIFSEVAVN